MYYYLCKNCDNNWTEDRILKEMLTTIISEFEVLHPVDGWHDDIRAAFERLSEEFFLYKMMKWKPQLHERRNEMISENPYPGRFDRAW